MEGLNLWPWVHCLEMQVSMEQAHTSHSEKQRFARLGA